MSDQLQGSKDDADKPDWTLIPWRGMTPVVRVLMFGARKYGRANWRLVADADRRYLAAAFRHLAAYADGEAVDQETGESHLAHAVCCLLFLLGL